MRYAVAVAVAAAAAIFATLVPAAQAATECKAAYSAGTGFTDSDAITSWRNQVSAQYGAAWADFDMAAAKSWTSQPLIVQTLYFLSAKPCRTVTLPGRLDINKFNGQLQVLQQP